MTFSSSIMGRAVKCLILAAVVLTIAIPSANAQLPQLVIEVGDTTGAANEVNTVISVFLTNYFDTVAGFNIWLQLDRPDIMLFQTDSQTVIDTSYWDCLATDSTGCIDSVLTNPLGPWDFTNVDTSDVLVGSWDSVGTLISGWQSVDARSLSGFGFDLNIAAIANMPDGDTIVGIPPQQSSTPLIKLLADVLDVPDTSVDRTVNIIVQHDFIDHFNFARPNGTTIGLSYNQIIDTNYYVCTLWAGSVCLNWQRTSNPAIADSLEFIPDSVAFVDPDSVIIIDGSLTVSTGTCGDINSSNDPEPNVSDLTFLVSYLFKGGPAPSPLWVANVDCSTDPEPNVSDLTYLVSYLFKGGPAPCEGPLCP